MPLKKNDNTIIVLSNDTQETCQLHVEVNGTTEIGNETNHTTPEKTEKEDDHITEVNGITEISGDETQV